MRRGMPASAAELSYLEKKVLLALEKPKKATPEELRTAGKFRELVEVMNAASWLQAKGLVAMKERVVHTYRLARPDVARRSLPERKALKALIKAGGRPHGRGREDPRGRPRTQGGGRSADDGSVAFRKMAERGLPAVRSEGLRPSRTAGETARARRVHRKDSSDFPEHGLHGD